MISHYIIFVQFVMLCFCSIMTSGKPTGVSLTSNRLQESSGLSEKYKQKVILLKSLMAKVLKLKISGKDLTPEFDDMILPSDMVDQLIKRYKSLLKNRRKKRPKRKIFEFVVAKENFKWDVSKPISYIVSNEFSEDAEAKIDQAIQHWETHTCIRFKKVMSEEPQEHYIKFRRLGTCASRIGKDTEVGEFQTIIVHEAMCTPFVPITIHEIGHALGLVHEQMNQNSQSFIDIHYERIKNSFKINFSPMQGVASLGLPYDLTSIMHYGAADGSSTFAPPITTKDPLYQRTIGQRTGLSFLDKKIVNLEYCKDVCPKILPCKRTGYTDPNNCARCVCPDGFGGRLCDTVGDVHHKACQKPQIIKVTDREQCITMGTYKPFTECNWHLQAENGQKIQLYFKGTFSVYCTEDEVCQHWVEIKYKTDLDVPGPRFCCDTTPDVTLMSDSELVVVTFKSNYKDRSVKEQSTQGFQLCYKLGSCKKEVLRCDTMDQWEISTQPNITRETFKAAIAGCQGNLKAMKKINFKIKLVGGLLFKVDKLCVTRSGARTAVVIVESPTGGMASIPIYPEHRCLDAKTFMRVGIVKAIRLELRSKNTMSISDVEVEVCKQ